MDATMFLGLEARPGSEKSQLAGHPLSTRVTDLLAMDDQKIWRLQFSGTKR